MSLCPIKIPIFSTIETDTRCCLANLKTAMLAESSVVSGAPGLGQGTHVAQATIPSQGLGLFASRSFRRGEIITWYDGFVIPKEDLWSEFLLYQPGSHTLTLAESEYAVQGLQHPIKNWGGASFINHRPAELSNCAYIILPPHKHRLQYSLPPLGVDDIDLPICVMRATRDIEFNEELLADYTKQTCAILGIFYDHVIYHK